MTAGASRVPSSSTTASERLTCAIRAIATEANDPTSALVRYVTMSRELVASVTLKDCDVQVFRAGGKGGQHQNTSNTGVRVIHRASGARGESREQRSQLQNKKAAFRRMASTAEFQRWAKIEAGRSESMEAEVAREVDRQMQQVRVEVRQEGRWVTA
jgi:protein subunit release factor B